MKHTYTTYGESIDLFRNSTYDKNLCVDFVFAAPHVYQIYSCLAVSKSSTTFLPEASFEGGLIQYDNKTLIKKANKINEQSKAIDDEGRFSGYASVFNVKDNTNDLVMPRAFRDNLKYPEKIRLLWQHDTLKPIGRVNTLYEDKHGLYVECQILLDLSQGREAYFLIKKGVIKHMSIGYNAEDFFHKGNIRYIRKIKLWEVSLVTFAANKEAKITDIDLKALSENAKKLEQAATKLNWI